MPATSSADAAIIAAQKLVHALHHPEPALLFATVQSDQDAALATLPEHFLCRSQSTPCPPPVLPPRVCVLPVHPMVPPRVPVTLPRPQFPAAAPAARQRPSIIEPNENNPVCHRYHLRSQINLSELLPNQQAKSVIDSATGKVHKNRHLAHGPNKAISIKVLPTTLGA